MSADSSFNPYLKWLGIPPQEQPPNHYRLLAIPQFENDPEVIENAAHRQASYIRTFRLGKHVEHCEKLLTEIAAAKLCLLDASRKAGYDKQLKGTLPASPSPAIRADTPVRVQNHELNDEDELLLFRCPYCSTKFSGKVSEAGEPRKCPQCQQAFRIPEPKTAVQGESLPASTPTPAATSGATQVSPAPSIQPSSGRISTAKYRRVAKGGQWKVVLLSWGLNVGLLALVGVGFYFAMGRISEVLNPPVSDIPSNEPPAIEPPTLVRPRVRTTEPKPKRTTEEIVSPERLWNDVLSSMPTMIDVTQPGEFALRIGQIPNQPIPWEMSVDPGFAELGESQEFTVSKDLSSAKWSIQLVVDKGQPAEFVLLIVEFELANSKLLVNPASELAEQAIGKQLRFCSLQIVSDKTHRRIRFGQEVRLMPLVLDLTEPVSEVKALDVVPDLDNLTIEIETIHIDVTAWENAVGQSAIFKGHEAYVNGVLGDVTTRVTAQLQNDKTRRLPLGEEEVLELQGRVPIRIGVSWDLQEDSIVLKGVVEVKDGSNWRRLTAERVGEKFRTIRDKYVENQFKYTSLAAQIKQLAGQCTTLRAEIAQIPPNTVSMTALSRRRTLAAQLGKATAAINTRQRNRTLLGRTIPRQLRELQETTYVLIVAMGLHKHTRVHFRLVKKGRLENDAGLPLILSTSDFRFLFSAASWSPHSSRAAVNSAAVSTSGTNPVGAWLLCAFRRRVMEFGTDDRGGIVRDWLFGRLVLHRDHAIDVSAALAGQSCVSPRFSL